MTVRPLTINDAAAFVALRGEALCNAPLAFGSSPEDDRFAEVDRVREHLSQSTESCVFGAFDQELVGTVGVYRNPKLKSAHKAQLWGMYVTPAARRQGIAAALLRAAIAHTRTLSGVTHLHLSVTIAAPAALHLYEQAGFRVWGTEPESLSHAGQTVDEHHMVLRVDPT